MRLVVAPRYRYSGLPHQLQEMDDPALVSDQPGDRNTAPVTCRQRVYEAFMSAKERVKDSNAIYDELSHHALAAK